MVGDQSSSACWWKRRRRVKLAKNLNEVEKIADDMLGMKLITPQTSSKGKIVNQILTAEDVYYQDLIEQKEFYISVLLDEDIMI